MRALGAEIQPDAILAAERARGVRLLGLGSPAREFGKDVALDDTGPRFPPVLPWEETIPGLEGRAGRARDIVGGARQRKVADRGDMGVGIAGLGVAALDSLSNREMTPSSANV